VAWVLRLVKIDAEGERQATDVMAIERLGDLADIANLGLTLAETKRLLAGLQQALANADSAQLRHWAHTLKSNAMMVGAEALARQFQELERIAGSNSIGAAAAKVATARDNYQKLMVLVGKWADGARAA